MMMRRDNAVKSGTNLKHSAFCVEKNLGSDLVGYLHVMPIAYAKPGSSPEPLQSTRATSALRPDRRETPGLFFVYSFRNLPKIGNKDRISSKKLWIIGSR